MSTTFFSNLNLLAKDPIIGLTEEFNSDKRIEKINDLFKSNRVLIGGDDTKTGKKAIKKLVEIYSNWIPKEKILSRLSKFKSF